MQQKILLITPPFTQLNTSYPASAYLKGFLEEKNVAVEQCDLSIELFTSIFTSGFIRAIFSEAQELNSFAIPQVFKLKEQYVLRVDKVISYLQSQTIEKANEILAPGFLPKGHRLQTVKKNITWADGELGIIDKAKHYGTLFIEELGDFIQANVDEFFAFTRYAEQIGTSDRKSVV
jgi:hypothetical protein